MTSRLRDLQERTAAAARQRSEMAVVACSLAVYPHYNTPSAKFLANSSRLRTPPTARDVASVSAAHVQAVRGELEARVRTSAASVDQTARTAARLAESGRQAHAAAADANSQFDSVARLVAYAALMEHPLSTQTPATADTLRVRVAVWLQANRATLDTGLNRQNCLAAAPGFNCTNVTEMAGAQYDMWCRGFKPCKDNRWGDQYSLQALAEVLDVDIYLWSTRGELYDLRMTPGRRIGPAACSRGVRERKPIELLELLGGVYCPVVDTRVTHLQ